MIDYQSENVELPQLDFSKISRWLTAVAADYGCRIGNLVYKFCDDQEILRVNKEFLRHDYYTDIITFDYTVGDKVGADIIISLDTVSSNAESFGVAYEEELRRVMVHGLLHLFGIKDKKPEERAEMESAENRALQSYDTI